MLFTCLSHESHEIYMSRKSIPGNPINCDRNSYKCCKLVLSFLKHYIMVQYLHRIQAPWVLVFCILYSVFSGRSSKPGNSFSLNTVISISIKRLPLLSGRNHPFLSPRGLFLLSSTCIERSLKAEILK